MSSHIIIQHITQQCRSSIQVCCSCRNKITTKKWSSSKLSRDLPVSWCGGHSFPDVIRSNKKGVHSSSKQVSYQFVLSCILTSASLSLLSPPPPPLIDAELYLWTLSSSASASASAIYLFPFTRQGTSSLTVFNNITTARNYYHNMCGDRSLLSLTWPHFQRWRIPWVQLTLLTLHCILCTKTRPPAFSRFSDGF